MNALFKARDTFIIIGRGLVLTGWVVEGTLQVGMTVSLPYFPRRLTIDGFEFIKSSPKVDGIIGLLFRSTDKQEIALWKSLDISDIVFEVTES